MRIREAQSRDAAALLALHQQLFPAQRATLGSVRQLMAAAATLTVAEQNGQVLGYAAAYPVPGLPQLVDLAGGVAPEQRRQGVGTHLLKALLETLQRQPYQALTYAVTDMASPAAPAPRSLMLGNPKTCELARWCCTSWCNTHPVNVTP